MWFQKGVIAGTSALAVCGGLLCACGGSDVSNPSGGGLPPGPAGYYAGSLVSDVSGVAKDAVALITDDGQLRIIERGYDTQFLATLPEASEDLHLALSGYLGLHADLPGPVTGCTGTLDATLIAAAEFFGSYRCGNDHGSFDLIFDATVSFDPPLPASLTGVLQGEPRPTDIVVLTVAPDGSYSGSDTFGCSYSGSFAPADPVIGVYSMRLRVDCGAGLRTLSGLAMPLDPGRSGSLLYYGVSQGNDALSGTLVFQ